MQHPIHPRMKQLHRMLNDWDFLGVGQLSAHEDEYDCLLGPLLIRLAAGADVGAVARFLQDEIDGHFGVDSARIDVADFAAKTVAWWQSEQSRPTP